MNYRAVITVTFALAGGVAVVAAQHVLSPAAAPRAQEGILATTRSLTGLRELNLRWGNEALVDITFETCNAFGLKSLAARYGVPASIEAVARAFAAEYEPGFREGSYAGCREGLEQEPGATRVP